MNHIKSKRNLLAALGLVLALAALAGFIRWQAPSLEAQRAALRQAASVAERKARTGGEMEREMTVPGVGQQENESEILRQLADYWDQHVSAPTGYFNGAWLQEAAAQDRLVPAGLPDGRVTYNRGGTSSPLALDPTRFISLGPQPVQTDGCFSCFNYGKVSGRINTVAIDPVMSSTVYIGADGGGVWKTTNCCSAATTWTTTTDDPLVSTTAIDEITIDPNNRNVVYAATGDFRRGTFVFGANGILKSTNAGGAWSVIGANVFTPTFESPSIASPFRWEYQAVSAIKVDPRNSNTLIAGTKNGLFLSYDAGTNWTGPCYTNAFSQTQRQDTTELLVHNNGASTTIYNAIGYNLATGPGGFNNVANGANGIYSATVPLSGCPVSWQLITRGDNGWPAGTGDGTPAATKPARIDLAIAPTNPNILYAAVSNVANSQLLGVWRTNDRGVTWTQPGTLSDLRDCNGSPLSGSYAQHWYDQAIAIDPNNPDVIIMSGVDIWRSIDGGNTYWDIACGYSGGTTIHVDQHDTRYLPGSSTMLLQGNDGGIYFTPNVNVISPTIPNWQQMNETMSTLEFYGGDVTANFATAPQPGANGGTQDNNSMVAVWPNPAALGPVQWQARNGGDGVYAQIEPIFAQRWYQESQNGNLQVSTNGPFGPLQSAVAPGNWGGDTRSFLFPYEIFHGTPGDPANDCNLATGCTHMIAGTTRVWETLQGGVPNTSWYTNSLNLTRGFPARNYINRVHYATTISTTAIVGTMDGYVWFGFGLGQGVPQSATWVNVTTDTLGMGLPERPVMDVRTSPANPLVGWAVLAGFDQNTPSAPGHVFQITCTANCASSTLVNKTGNLPNIPINAVIGNPLFPQQVFVGSDWGLYFTNNINANPPTWTRFNAGLPNVKIWDLTIDRGATTLVVWTRGRGAWAWPITSAPIVIPSPTATVTGTPPTATRTAIVTASATATAGPCFNYTTITGTATIISGTTDIGNHCDDCATTINLPFPVTVYDRTFNQGYANSNGAMVFGPAVASLYNNCLPDRNSQYTVFGYQNDLCTTGCGGQTCATCGIFTTTVGTAPNRQFIIEWRAIYFDPTQGPGLNFEIILNENSSTIRVVYGVLGDAGLFGVSGIQQTADTRWTQFSCRTATLTPGLRVDYVRNACPTATPGPSNTATATRTATAQVTVTTVCPPGTPTRIPTPNFTPAPGCGNPGSRLSGDITLVGNTSVAVFRNRSNTCSYPIGLAVYKRFDNNIDNQELYDYRLAVIAPNSTLTLTVTNPPCSFQVDAFWGDILYSFAGGVRYGSRLLQDEVRMNGGYCTIRCNLTPTPGATNTAVATAAATNTRPPATGTAAATSTPGCAGNAHFFTVTLSGANEVPPNNSPATGSGTMFLDAGGTLHWNITFQGLVAPESAAHFHVAPAGVNGPVIIPLPLGSPKIGSAPFPPTYTADLLAGNVYLNIHSTQFPGGEIRDQLHEQCGTPTPGATRTATRVATGTPVAVCGTFSDVDPTNPFYAFVRCLACSQILSGYADGTFRWGAEVTRGQLAKILANAAGYTDTIPATQQTFSDVPPSHPFWLYVERLALHGAIAGYADGTYRPSASATRGQIAKIAATAANLSNTIPPTRQTFSDVPGTNPFWVYVERLAAQGMISGYADGTFRWGSNATRGQLAKIAAQTFQLDCAAR